MTCYRSRRTLTVIVMGIGLWMDLFGTYLPYLFAQQPLPSPAQERELTRTEAYLRAFRNDSVLVLTSRLLADLKARGQLNTPFGIRVQLAEADAYEQQQQSDIAMKKLLHVQQQSSDKKRWDSHARACLILALVYEKLGRKASSREQLDLAKADIDRYGLATIYPYYAVRMSSWQRFYNQQDSALFYARQAFRTATDHKLIYEAAISQMLLASLLPQTAFAERIRHCRAGVRLYRQLGDQTGTTHMLHALARLYFQQNQFRQALAYNDSTLALDHRIIAEGHAKHEFVVRTYRLRGEIYEAMHLLDSALVNTRKSYELQLSFQQQNVSAKVAEIDDRYQTKLKQKQIDEQQLALRLKNNELGFSAVVGGLVFLLAGGLYRAYRKQRRDKQTLARQNALVEQQATQLKALDATKSRFFANVSHELRTPLTLLLGPVGTLLDENQLTDRQASLMYLAQRNGRQLEQLVTDILDLGKLELGQLTLDAKPTPVTQFFRSHLAQFASLIESRQLRYTTSVDVPNDVVASLDQPKCRQLLNNLLANAIKFTPADGQITVSLSLTDGRLHLSVADTGAGIHPDDLPHVFDRYFQTTRPDKPAEGGTGIGLALCQEYTQLMGGTIGVSSTLGEGTVFRVEFPVAVLPAHANVTKPTVMQDSPEPAPTRPLQPTGNVPTDKPTILVVEDNPDLRDYLCLLLSEHYNCVTAENGQVALDHLRANQQGPHRVSLILSDIMMPVMDGHQLLARLKADEATRHLPVVMLTARADVRDKLWALRVGVDDYLLKPFETPELLARLANLLANQTARQQALAEPPHPALPQINQQWLETFEGYVRQHMADITLTVPHLAEQFAMSESTLLRQLKRLTGLSPSQYVQAVRLDQARYLLENRVCNTVAEVAARTGYEDARSFSRSFRARFGKLPSELLEG